MNWMSTGLVGGRLTGADPIDDSSLFFCLSLELCCVPWRSISCTKNLSLYILSILFFLFSHNWTWVSVCYVVATVRTPHCATVTQQCRKSWYVNISNKIFIHFPVYAHIIHLFFVISVIWSSSLIFFATGIHTYFAITPNRCCNHPELMLQSAFYTHFFAIGVHTCFAILWVAISAL